MNRFFDVLSLVQIPIGFLLGLAVLLILEIVKVGFWGSAGILAVVVLLFLAWTRISDVFSFNVFDWFLATKKEREMHRKIDARDRKIGRIALPLGVVLAFIAAQIWSPLEISRALF